MRKQSLDKTDIAIIGHLQQDGRRAFTTIAKDLGISEASVRQRVSRLLRTNIIQIVAVSSPLDLGLIWGQVQLRVAGDRLEAVAEELAELPQVDFVSICAGDYDIIVGVVAHDREELLRHARQPDPHHPRHRAGRLPAAAPRPQGQLRVVAGRRRAVLRRR